MGPLAVIGGTGRQGFGLAARWARAGYRVIVGSRQAAKAEEAAGRIRTLLGGGEVAGAANPEAAGGAEIIVLTIPFAAQTEILGAIAGPVVGKVVIDTTVPLRQGSPPELETIAAGSAAAQAQAALPGARVVATFHTLSSDLLGRLEEPLQGDVLVCGNDTEAKRVAIALAEAIGVRALDAGPLAQAAALERLAAVIIGLNKRYGRKSIGVRFTGV